MTTKLKPYDISGAQQEMLQQVFFQPAPMPVYQKRSRPSVLRQRVMGGLSINEQMNRHSDDVMEAVLRSIQNSWDNYTEGSVAPNEFMRTPFGAPYEVVDIEGKRRGMRASRDIKARETILEDTPLLVLPPGSSSALIFLTLAQKALEAISLLHNVKPNCKRFSWGADIPIHRLMDLPQGIVDTNSFAYTRRFTLQSL